MNIPYLEVVRKITDMGVNQMYAVQGNMFKETLRELRHIFSNIFYTDSNGNLVKVHCVTSKQDRVAGKANQENSLVLPYISITETGSTQDNQRSRNDKVLINESYWDPKERRAKRILSLAPTPININYRINIWCKFVEEMDMIRNGIQTIFNPSLTIPTKYSDYTKAFLQNEIDIASPEAPDTKDRLIQKSIEIRVETYLPSPKFLYTNTGEIQSFNADVQLFDMQQNMKTDDPIETLPIEGSFASATPISIDASAQQIFGEIYVLCGQSNAEGATPVSSLPDEFKLPISRCKVLDVARKTGDDVKADGLQPWYYDTSNGPGFNTLYCQMSAVDFKDYQQSSTGRTWYRYGSSGNIGPEFGLISELLEGNLNKNIYLVKYAVPGTRLALTPLGYDATISISSVTWNINGPSPWLTLDFTQAGSAIALSGHNLYYALNQFIGRAIDLVKQEGLIPVVKGIFFVQGESDSFIAGYPEQYTVNLLNFINDLRNKIYLSGGSFSTQIPFVANLINSYNNGDQGRIGTVRQAQMTALSLLPKCGYTDGNNFELNNSDLNLLHYSAKGYIDLGRALARAYKQLL